MVVVVLIIMPLKVVVVKVVVVQVHGVMVQVQSVVVQIRTGFRVLNLHTRVGNNRSPGTNTRC